MLNRDWLHECGSSVSVFLTVWCKKSKNKERIKKERRKMWQKLNVCGHNILSKLGDSVSRNPSVWKSTNGIPADEWGTSRGGTLSSTVPVSGDGGLLLSSLTVKLVQTSSDWWRYWLFSVTAALQTLRFHKEVKIHQLFLLWTRQPWKPSGLQR